MLVRLYAPDYARSSASWSKGQVAFDGYGHAWVEMDLRDPEQLVELRSHGWNVIGADGQFMVPAAPALVVEVPPPAVVIPEPALADTKPLAPVKFNKKNS